MKYALKLRELGIALGWLAEEKAKNPQHPRVLREGPLGYIVFGEYLADVSWPDADEPLFFRALADREFAARAVALDYLNQNGHLPPLPLEVAVYVRPKGLATVQAVFGPRFRVTTEVPPETALDYVRKHFGVIPVVYKTA